MAAAWRLYDGRERPVAWCPCSSPCPRAERTARRLSAPFQCRVPFYSTVPTQPPTHTANCHRKTTDGDHRDWSIPRRLSTPRNPKHPAQGEREVRVCCSWRTKQQNATRWQALRPAQRRLRRFRGRTDRPDHRSLGQSEIRANFLEPSPFPSRLRRLWTPLPMRTHTCARRATRLNRRL